MSSSNSPTREVTFRHDENVLTGTLFLPKTGLPQVALGMLQGSGAADRDNLGYFPLIREILLDAGAAILAWDKPGIGGSSGDWREQTLNERADEAIAAVRFLRDQPETRGAVFGLFGHSQGGWVAPIAAALAPAEIDFIVAQSGPGISVREQAMYDVEHSMRYKGHPENEIQEAISYVQQLQEAADQGASFETVEESILVPSAGRPCLGYFSIPDPMMWNYFRRSWHEDPHPKDILPQVECPVLALFGEDDALVPAGLSAQVFSESLSSGGNDDVTIRVFSNTGHVLFDLESQRFVDGYPELLTSWLQQRTPGH